MGRPLRLDRAGYVYHVLNRANGRLPIFQKDGDYQAFLRILAETQEHVPAMRLLAYCLMPNHWHLVLWPRHDGELADFVHWLTLTHTQRWHAHYQNVGCGHLYQGRYKSFPVAEDDHYFSLCRYVERNGLRAALVQRAEEWRWASLWLRRQDLPGSASAEVEGQAKREWPALSDGPLSLPRSWVAHVNRVQSERELEALRRSVERSQPYGSEAWVKRAATALGLESTLRSRGRPKKAPGKGS